MHRHVKPLKITLGVGVRQGGAIRLIAFPDATDTETRTLTLRDRLGNIGRQCAEAARECELGLEPPSYTAITTPGHNGVSNFLPTPREISMTATWARLSLGFVFALQCIASATDQARAEAPSDAAAVGGVAFPTIEPPELAGGMRDIILPSTIDDIVVGGGGRHIILQFKALSKLGIFDVNKLKIVGYVPAPDANVAFAAGATKLVVVSGESGVIARWDLATQTKELSQAFSLGTTKLVGVMGSASAGPMIIGASDGTYGLKYHAVDLETLRVTPLNLAGQLSSGTNVRMAANGSVMGYWASGLSPSGLNCLVQTGDRWTSQHEHTSVGYIVPSPDGRILYTGGGLFTNQLRPLGPHTEGDAAKFSIPAIQGPYSLTVTRSGDYSSDQQSANASVVLKLEGDDRALASIPNLDPVWDRRDQWGGDKWTLEKRLMLIPDAQLVLQVLQTKDKIRAIHFDIEKALAESSVDYLIVTSRPPLSLKAGDTLSYELQVKSKATGVGYSLDSGPDGMKISPTGLLTWATNAKSPAKSNIIVTVSNKSGQQLFHTFPLSVQGGDTTGSSVASAPPAKTVATPAATSPTTPSSIGDSKTVALPGTVSDVCVGGSGRYLLLSFRELKKIGVFDVSQAKLTGYLPAPDDITKFAAGQTRALVVSASQGVIARYRLTTLEREVSVSNPITEAIQQVAMGSGSEGPALFRTSVGEEQLDNAHLTFLDLGSLKPLTVSWPQGRPPRMSYRDNNRISVSTNGAMFSVMGVGALRLSSTRVQFVGDDMQRMMGGGAGGYPSADGSSFLRNGQVLNADQRPIGTQDPQGRTIAVPSITGRYYISFLRPESHSGRGTPGIQNAKLFMFGDDRPLVTIPDLAVGLGSDNEGYGYGMGWERRIFFVPEAEVIVTLPATSDRLEMRRMNIGEALEASGVDYLVVDSTPPPTATMGKAYTYAIGVKSKKGGVKFSLDSGPPGMTVSPNGQLNWPVPKDLTDAKQNVVVSVGDETGQSIFHTFTIEVPEVAVKAEAEKKQLEEQRTLAQQEAQRRQQEAARAQEAATQQRMREAAELRAQKKAEQANPVVLRTWTDASGTFRITGTLVEIIDKKTVVLKMENGEIRKIALAKLSDGDIYEAVRLDLQRQSNAAVPSQSPFGRD